MNQNALPLDLVIRNIDIASKTTMGRHDIGIRDGHIVTIGAPYSLPDAASTVLGEGLVALPGLVDAHVHFRSPGHEARETFESGSRAAAAGGVTTVLEMPTSTPTVVTPEILEERSQYLRGRSVVDFGLYAGAGRQNADQLEMLARAGAVGFKSFLHAAPPGREDSIGLISVTNSRDLLELLEASASTGIPHAVHCEDDALLGVFMDRAEGTEASFGVRHVKSRPMVVESVATSAAAFVGLATEAKLHIVHASSPHGVRLVDALRRSGLDATIEVTPHHLFFDETLVIDQGRRARCNPPLRSAAVRAELVALLESGLIDSVASDHCPYTETELEPGQGTLAVAPAGLPGIQYMLPILLSLVHDGSLSMRTVAMAASYNPARRFGLATKGDIAVGLDADIVLVDPESAWTFADHVAQTRAHYHAGVFEGIAFKGSVRKTLLRGIEVFDAERGPASEARGVQVRPHDPAGL